MSTDMSNKKYGQFKKRIKELGEKVKSTKRQNISHHDVIRLFVLPLFHCLGYDINCLTGTQTEVGIPLSRGRASKDIVLHRRDVPYIVVECKTKKLPKRHRNQLWVYFQSTPSAQFGVLTNGAVYQFFGNKGIGNAREMELDPFFEFDITALKDYDFRVLRDFREALEPEYTLNIAAKLRCQAMIKRNIHKAMFPSP